MNVLIYSAYRSIRRSLARKFQSSPKTESPVPAIRVVSGTVGESYSTICYA